MPGESKIPSFLASVVEGDAIHPITDSDRKDLEGRKWIETKVIVTDPLNSKMKQGSVHTIKQRYSMCSEFFFSGAIYRVESESKDGIIRGGTCNIHLHNTENVSKDTDPELLNAVKEVTELEQMRWSGE
jgi:hypothetical protein